MTETDGVLFNFTTNWNHKLNCDHFTTLRASGKHDVGDTGIITLKREPQFNTEIIRKIEIDITTAKGNFLDYMGFLDTGYDWKETLKIINTMYAGKLGKIYYYLIKKTKTPVKQEGGLF